VSTADDAAKLAGKLLKQGKATIKVSLVAYANDLDFAKNVPSCRVSVVARDPGENNKVVYEESLDISTNQPPYNCDFTVPVQTVVGSLLNLIGVKRYRALKVDITATPIGGAEKWYEVDASNSGLSIKAGSAVSRNVALKPTYEGSRFDEKPMTIDKPVRPRRIDL
jgi:hypothetical protein